MILGNELSDQAIFVTLERICGASTDLMPGEMPLLGTATAEKEIVVDFVLCRCSRTIKSGY